MDLAVDRFDSADMSEPLTAFPKQILVAWWDEDIADLARSLSIFAPRGSNVVILSAEKPEVERTLRLNCQAASI